MRKSQLKPKIMTLLKKKTKGQISEQAIRNELSEIRAENPGITLNAAASIFASKRGFRIMKYLTEDDRQSLQNIPNIVQQPIRRLKKQTLKTRRVTTSFGQEFLSEANRNAEIYPYVYILENSLRKLILHMFKSEPNWWCNRVIRPVQDYASSIQKAEVKHDWLPKRGSHPIYYIGLNELYKIICRNYSKYFKSVFKDQGHLRTWINECTPIRNLLAHNVKVKSSERQNLIIRTTYICTLIEKYYRQSKVTN